MAAESTMASKILTTVATWLAKYTLDQLIDSTKDPDITAGVNRIEILHFIEKKDEWDSQRRMWGLLYEYNQIFRETNVLIHFQNKIGGIITMGGLIANVGDFPNLQKFWEMIVGKKIFSSVVKEYHPDVHPEVRALLKTQMVLLLEYAMGMNERARALKKLETYWKEEFRMDSNYCYGQYWETQCCFSSPYNISILSRIVSRYGRIWDGAKVKWYARIREIYKEEILAKAEHKALDPNPGKLSLYLFGWYGLFSPKPEAARIDAEGDWFNDDAGRIANELLEKLSTYMQQAFYGAEPPMTLQGWPVIRDYDTTIPRHIPSIEIPLDPK